MHTRRRACTFFATAALLCGFATAGSAAQAAEDAAAAKKALGIDVSNHNGSVDFKAVRKDGRDFAFVLATDGAAFTSGSFTEQYRGAGKAGLFRGAYHFARPDGSATKQANHFLKVVDYHKDGKSLPPALDMEANPAGPPCYGLSHKQMKAWIKDFVGKVRKKTGRDAIIYTSPAFWRDCTGNSKEFKGHPLWIAQWGVSTPDHIGGWSGYTFWQYSDSGHVAGASGAVDLNRFNGGATGLKKLAQG